MILFVRNFQRVDSLKILLLQNLMIHELAYMVSNTKFIVVNDYGCL
jgi:hypothetical protein